MLARLMHAMTDRQQRWMLELKIDLVAHDDLLHNCAGALVASGHRLHQCHVGHWQL